MTDGLPQPQRFLAFLTIAIAITMAVLDTSIVNVALPVIGQELATSPARSVWIVNAYQLAITVSLLPLAALGDILGYKRVYWTGLAVFTLASLACASAHDLAFLAAARVVQGFGAAGIMSVNIALVRFIYPKAQLGVGVGYASLIVAVSSAAGPSVAAVILSLAHWQWLFLVNVPLGLLALAIGARTLPATPISNKRLDALSVVLNACAFGLFISGLTAFSERGDAPSGILMVVAGLAFTAALVHRERRQTDPMLPLDLLRMPVFSLSMVTSVCSFASQTMAFIALSFFLQRTLGHSEAQTGLILTAWPLATALVAPLAGRWSDRVAPALISSAGLICLGLGLAALCWLGDAPTPLEIGWRLALCGIGFGLFQSPNNRVIMGSAPKARSGGASGLQSMGRLLGQSLGAVAVAMAFGRLHEHQAKVVLALAATLALLAAGTSLLRRRSHAA